MQIKKVYIKLLFFTIFTAPPLYAMAPEQLYDRITALPKETFLHICIAKQGKKPWEELALVLELQHVCTSWKTFLLENRQEIVEKMHIPLIHYAAAMGLPEAIIASKLRRLHSVREPDENGYSPSDYAIGMKKQKAIDILRLGNALKTNQIPILAFDQVIPDPEYTLQNINDALQNDKPEQLSTILINVLHNPDKGVPMLLTIDWTRAASWAERCRSQLVYAVLCDLENDLFAKIESGEAFPEDFFEAFNTMCANPNAYNFKGFTPLHDLCSLPERASTVKFLLTCDGIDVNCLTKQGNENGVTPLHLTADYNNSEALKALLSSPQCNVNACNKEWGTPLHVATAKNHPACVRLLINHKADIYSKIKDHSNVTPLHYAAQHATTDTLASFFEISGCPIKIDIKDDMDHTPLWRAVGSDSFACMQYLLDKNADVTGVTETRGKTLLQYAATQKSIQCLPTLLALLGHTINYTDKCGQRAVHWAARNGHASFIEPLVNAGTLVNIPDFNGDTAMSYAASRGHIDVILKLVKYGASVNSASNADRHFDDGVEHAGNFTPLHYATHNGHLETVKTLVQQCKADTTVQTQLGKTALEIAKERGHNAIIEFLMANTCSENH